MANIPMTIEELVSRPVLCNENINIPYNNTIGENKNESFVKQIYNEYKLCS